MRKGLFRTKIPGIGECARVDMSAGDAAPYLERSFYELLHFEPAFESLPSDAAFSSRKRTLSTGPMAGFPRLPVDPHV